ncbi:hypothetical protein Sango_1121600 [Sesamum angolense]|uniref:Uncharacterized protein n=1 Tax=Sesamum angolense TaxID=2727404 RepID=A0AAE1WV69_9LAMI|nr:hypothetical protein Sango_1121600 [Sesamum angolense]
MGSRVPVEHYNLTSAAANSYIGTSLHDLNSGDDVTDPAADDVTDDNDDRSSAVVSPLPLMADNVKKMFARYSCLLDCMHESYQSSLPLHSMGVEDDRSSLENNGSSSGPYSILTIDVNEVNMRLSSMSGMREKTIGVALEAAGGLYRKLAKKFPRKGPCTFKRRELATSFETRSRFPELVIQEEKRVRFVVVNGLAIVEKPTKSEKSHLQWGIGGKRMNQENIEDFRRIFLFKRLTGRSEVAVSARDYKFYAPRHKYRRVISNSISNIPGLPTFPSPENSSSMATSQGYRPPNEVRYSFCWQLKFILDSKNRNRRRKASIIELENRLRSLDGELAHRVTYLNQQNTEQTPPKQHMQTLAHQPQFHPIHQGHHHINQSPHATHFMHNQQCVPPPQMPEIAHNQQPLPSPNI